MVSFCKKVPLFLKWLDLRFCTPLQRFGWILKVWDLLRGPKNDKKQLPYYHRFLLWKKVSPKVLFNCKLLFGVIVGSLLVDFWSLLVEFWKVVGAFLWKCLGDRSGTAFGSILGSFCNDFMNMFVKCWRCFLREKCFYMHAKSFSKSFYLFVRLIPVGRHFKNCSFTNMETQFSRIRLGFEFFFYIKK